MQTQIKKWGNSLALRIPKIFAEQMAITSHSPVELSIVEGKLVIVPLYEQEFTLDGLLSKITEKNLHQEIDVGDCGGKEIW